MPILQPSYVQKFLNSAGDLPAALQRNLALIRELDERVHALKEEVQAQCSAQLAAAQNGSSLPAAGGGDRIQAQIRQILQLEDEKVALAAQIYGKVDNQIKELDGDLAALKSELQSEKDAAAERGEPTTADDKKHPKGLQDAISEDQLVAPDGASVMFDTNEPLYCYCQRVSFGEMIGCDNEDCPIEWFHYSCAGISPDNVPETWYCRDCQILKDQGKLEN